MKNSQKGFIVPVLVTIIALLIIGGGVYIYQNKKVEAPTVIDTGTQQTDQVQQTDTSDSKIYSGKYQDIDSGFYFNFPSDWKITQGKGLKDMKVSSIQSPDFNQVVHEADLSYTELKQGAEISVNVQTSSPVKTIKDLQEFNKLGRDNGPACTNERIIKVDGKDALLYDCTGYGGSLGYHLDLLNNNRWIRIEIGYKGLDGKKVLDAILSTFKFTQTSQANNSEPCTRNGSMGTYKCNPLNTYIYTNHGFSIELPKGFIPKEEQSEGGPALMISLPTGGLAYVSDASFWEKYNIPNYTYVTDKKIGNTTFKVYTAQGSNLYWLKEGNIGYEFSVQKFGVTTDTTGLENLLKTFKFVGWPQD